MNHYFPAEIVKGVQERQDEKKGGIGKRVKKRLTGKLGFVNGLGRGLLEGAPTLGLNLGLKNKACNVRKVRRVLERMQGEGFTYNKNRRKPGKKIWQSATRRLETKEGTDSAGSESRSTKDQA